MRLEVTNKQTDRRQTHILALFIRYKKNERVRSELYVRNPGALNSVYKVMLNALSRHQRIEPIYEINNKI